MAADRMAGGDRLPVWGVTAVVRHPNRGRFLTPLGVVILVAGAVSVALWAVALWKLFHG